MAPRRILVFGMTENPGGVESFLRNYYTHMNRESVQFDFLCNSYNPIAYEEEFKGMGARCFHFPPRHSHPIGFRHQLKKFLAENAGDYETIWVNVNSLANIDYLKLAKQYGIRRRIIHSHNSENMDSGIMGRIRGFLHKRNQKQLTRYATDYWACSEGAADYFYKGIKDADGNIRDRARVIHNAIDVEKMAFDPEGRSRHRADIGASESTLVLGNVGRLHFQKNQEFLLQWFGAFLKLHPDSRLVMIGAGEDEEKLHMSAKELGIADKVSMPGIQKDIPAWMSAFDIFAFPSVFEGVSLVGLEAQANGLPIFASETAIPVEARLFPDRLHFADLDKEAEVWAEELETYCKKIGREEGQEEAIRRVFDETGYNITKEAALLQEDLL